jgi:ribose transport system permease protein
MSSPASGRGSPKAAAPIIEVGGRGDRRRADQGHTASDSAYQAGRLARILTRRDTAALLIAAILWAIGLYLRPDFWGSIDNTFNLMLAFTEVGLLAIGLTFVIANGDIDLSVGSILALPAPPPRS